ncbi:MAG: cohesin domain-containing protein [Steroidobacteraceae bacterium]
MAMTIHRSRGAAKRCVLGILVLALSPVVGEAATVSLTPVSSTSTPGSPVTLDLNISGLGNGTALSAFDISVNFNSSIANFQSAVFGDPVLGDQLDLGHLGLNGPTAISGGGTVDLIETDIFDSPSTLLTGQAHSFTLAVLTLNTIAIGTTPITLTLDSLADQNGNPFVATTQSASLTVQPSPVPLPASAWLFLSGLGGLGAMFRCRRAASTSVV